MLRWLAAILLLISPAMVFAKPTPAPTHVWEKQELVFTATRDVANPYTDVTVWVDLKGPGFAKRVFGFWDGGRTWRVRLVATAPGQRRKFG
jgi:hypothetical protein